MEELDEDIEPHEGLLKVLSWLGFAAALGLLASQISVSSVWINSEDQNRKGDWSRIIE
jgi:hypothetical protein